MDACHALLGRPYQFDRSNDGRKKYINLKHKGKCIEFTPIKKRWR